MANTNAPFGLRQYTGGGSAPTYEQVVGTIKSDNAHAIYFGDPLQQLSTGYLDYYNSNSIASGCAGIFMGCKYTSIAMKRRVWMPYWPASGDASGDIEAYVCNDPNARFLVQSDSTGIGFLDIGANVGIALGTGNTSTGVSGAYLDVSTLNTTNTLPFRVVQLMQEPPGANGTATGAYNLVIVAFNSVVTKQLTGV